MAITEYRARFYDGRSAVARDVPIRLVAGMVEILDEERRPIDRWPLSTVTARGSLADDAAVTLSSSAAPEARLRLEERETVATVLEHLPEAARIDRLEPKSIARWTAVGLAVLALAAFVVHQLPALAAPLLPFDAKRAMGESVARTLFPNELRCTEPAIAPLVDLADRLRASAAIEEPLELLVVNHPMVNAFATPGGVVVVTRGLIDGAGDPDEVAGVLAHEIGHVQHDHPTQGMLRSIGISALLQFLTGGSDLEGLAGMGGTLAFLSYSRAAEEEADATAIEILTAAGLRTDGLGRFFGRLQSEEQDGGIIDLIPSWLSTHPPTEARQQATRREPTGAPALDDRAWAGLQSACSGQAKRVAKPGSNSGGS